MKRVELFNDHFQNFKRYNIPKAQLVLTDIPYNVGINAYGSNPSWYVGGDNKNGKASLPGLPFSIQTKTLSRPSLCISVRAFSGRNRKSETKRHA
jgi:hypothetical protein